MVGLLTAEDMRTARDRLISEGRTLVFTDGCFDILHRGHVACLEFVRAQGEAPTGPVVVQLDRAAVLLALRAVDYVVFENDEL